VTPLAAAAAVIPDGASVGVGRPGALALVRELLRQGKRDLHIVAVPTGSLAVELLVAGGAVRSIESSGVDFGELGFAPAFTRAVEEGRLESRDST
jgi:glutaconate CoA-transferase subunit A